MSPSPVPIPDPKTLPPVAQRGAQHPFFHQPCFTISRFPKLLLFFYYPQTKITQKKPHPPPGQTGPGFAISGPKPAPIEACPGVWGRGAPGTARGLSPSPSPVALISWGPSGPGGRHQGTPCPRDVTAPSHNRSSVPSSLRGCFWGAGTPHGTHGCQVQGALSGQPAAPLLPASVSLRGLMPRVGGDFFGGEGTTPSRCPRARLARPRGRAALQAGEGGTRLRPK